MDISVLFYVLRERNRHVKIRYDVIKNNEYSHLFKFMYSIVKNVKNSLLI